MIRLYLFAEGQTEQTFASQLLAPHLAQYEIYLKSLLIAHARKKGKTHRGGGGSYEAMKNDILRLLKQEKSKNVFFTTMIDLYAIPTQFPKLNESEKLRSNPQHRVEFLEQSFAEDIGDPRFISYIQLHEYEAYLFCDPICFTYRYNNCQNQIANLQAIVSQYETPELINDDPNTAPSKRIIAQFPEYERDKTSAGPDLAAYIGLQEIRNHCPHFNGWLSTLERLGQ